MTERSFDDSRSSSKTLDLDVLNDLRCLDTGSGPSIVQEMGVLFLTQIPVTLKEMEDLLHSQQFTQVKKIAHQLKSSSAGMGANRFSNLCEEIEMRGIESSFESLLKELILEFEAVKPLLQAETEK